MALPASILTRLQHQHGSLDAIIEGIGDTQLRRVIQPGKWSVFENMVHLSTYQHTFLHRMKQMLETDNPSFGRYSAEADPLFHDHCTRRTEDILQDLSAVRRKIIQTSMALSEIELARTGRHPAYGELNLAKWLEFFLLHEAHHLFAIFKINYQLKG